MNERKTENLVRECLRELGYKAEDAEVIVEEQRSAIAEVNKLLKNASKTGKGGIGSPEFIITSPKTPDFVLVVECKASGRNHESAGGDRPIEFAVDGVLHYAKHLAKKFHVIAVAVSGQSTSDQKISTYLHPREADHPRTLTSRTGAELNALLSWDDYLAAAEFDAEIENARISDLFSFSKELHDFMRDYGKLSESEKPLLVSGTLIALRNQGFSKSYGNYSPEQLQKQWISVIGEEIEAADIPQAKKQNMVQPYSSIAVHPNLGRKTDAHPKGVLHELISRLAQHVLPIMKAHEGLDVVGQFYGEFLKYTAGDGKSLGIVLTPRHVTELFSLIANVSKNDIVVDTCCGTGGFLISAMKQMLTTTTTPSEENDIRKNRLIGVEHQPKMYALAASNMILRGDGKANLYQGSCFDIPIKKAVREHQPTVGLINPPYSQKGEGLNELAFVLNMLDGLNPGAVGIAIVPISCATSPSIEKSALLKGHTLEAVMSMPPELFYPVGTVTCVMVFRAHKPHVESNLKTWFGFWKDDGFIKTKNLGRVDFYKRWPTIRDHWVESFRNREVHAGESVMQHVTATDEWVAEAYMATDYSTLTKKDFETVMREYGLFRLRQSELSAVTDGEP